MNIPLVNKSELTKIIRGKILAGGFHQVGIAAAEKLDKSELLVNWLKAGKHGSMSWMKNHVEARLDIKRFLPEARSVVMAAQNYYTDHTQSEDPSKGKISRYAWGRDYHKIIRKKLKIILLEMKQLYPGIEGKVFVDTAPVQEKLWAAQAGIGWLGKNTNIISRAYGSWIFLGGLALTIELEYDQPATDFCGKCHACIDACPTGALRPYSIDASRCISYLTIENKDDEIPVEFQDKLQNWIFGCDICQEVCPWNRKAVPTDEIRYHPDPAHIAPDLEEMTRLSEEDFKKQFAGSPVLRAKHKYFIRNVKTVLKSGQKSG
ncbi:MAG: tRNA epoxyqueuosine(34) reductase QueG [Calditrichaceae bacterium]|nr:tRNA epoxyqueuosine(34) reductase QueG [Calditrichaceae bacterium]MBN2709480.1 tRNA epoxyqueuosine(34) reductase QueG [Calditrichaceae bacterium]RQV94805.1 MAG: tRNA epoxyqueuosine(34) reductase QueG [Calditrichota bacterium]